MSPADVVLLAGPTDRPDHWSSVAADWPDEARRPIAPEPVVPPQRPYGVAWTTAHAAALHQAGRWGRTAAPLVLVGHGTAGPLLPALARTQRSARRRVVAYVFVDATLPRPGVSTHLDLLRAAAPADADAAHEHLHIAGSTWPAEADRPGDHDFWTEPLPPPIDWPDAPCAYLATPAASPGCGPVDFWARSAAARGWNVRRSADADDAALAAALSELIAALPGT